MTERHQKTVGLVGLYDDADVLIRAAETVRDSGCRDWDCHTPYPVHGLDSAMGLGKSPVPYVTLTAGFVGLAVAIALMIGSFTVLNLAMVSSVVPVIGLPLPFLSAGGSAMLTNLAAIGVLLNISATARRARSGSRWGN